MTEEIFNILRELCTIAKQALFVEFKNNFPYKINIIHKINKGKELKI